MTNTESLTSCPAVFTGLGGYLYENTRANNTFEKGKTYNIIGGSINQSYTNLEIEGFSGTWNSVMFEYDHKKAPLKFNYILTSRH